MLVVMKHGATPEQVDGVARAIEDMGYRARPMPGAQRTSVGLVGNDGRVEEGRLVGLEGVLRVIHVSQPYKQVSREWWPEDTVIELPNGVRVGGERKVFALRVSGESMIEDGILDGDFIFVRNRLAPKSGDTVVAMIDREATVKRYYPGEDSIRFQPANSGMEPIFVRRADFKDVDIIGVVVGVYRRVN